MQLYSYKVNWTSKYKGKNYTSYTIVIAQCYDSARQLAKEGINQRLQIPLNLIDTHAIQQLGELQDTKI